MSWTDDEVELQLGVVCAYSSQKDYESLEWESVKSKYEDIRKDFVTLYEQQDGLPYDVSLFAQNKGHTARQFHNHINESVIVITRGLNTNRCVSLSVDVVRSIFSGLLDWYECHLLLPYTRGIHDKHEIG